MITKFGRRMYRFLRHDNMPSSIARFLRYGLPAFMLLPALAFGQIPQVLITEGGTQVYCNALFYDSGGPDGNYSNNENNTITFCPGDPGDSIQIGFGDIVLSGGDVLTVYDGPNTSGPVLGSTDASMGGSLITSGLLLTANNASGCITVVFASNGSGVSAGWSASIQCSSPCPQPTASFPAFPESPYKVCPYDTLFLDAGASFAAPGRTIESYAWTIAGTTTYSPTPTVLLPVPTPGQFPIALVVTDDIGCASTNSSAELVRVGTYPDYSGMNITPSTVCVGESATLTGDVHGQLWSSVPDPIISGLFLLPDACPDIATYSSVLNVSGFPAGTTITSPTDIVSVCLNMEHSYIGDVIVSMTCPNGQSVLLFDGNDGGNLGTYLGGADDTGNGVPGVGAEYCFSSTAVWGTMPAENAANNWVTAGNPPGPSMTPGTYTPQDPFIGWIGCPLNGGWTLSVTDDQCIDDGYIFDMSMNIAPYLYPDVVEFTPYVGQDCDSSYWSGPDITSTNASCDVITIMPSTYGVHDYTYTVTDDFGCTYDSTFHFTVNPPANFHATATSTGCGTPVQMGVQFEAPIPVGTLIFNWTPAAGLSATNIAFPVATPPAPTWYKLRIYPQGHPLCGMVDSVFVKPLTHLSDDSLVVHPLCHGIPGSIQILTTGDGGPWDYTWTDVDGNVLQSTPGGQGDTFFGPGGIYTAHIAEGVNGTGCVDSVTAEIIEPELLQIASVSSDTTICLTGTATLNATAIGGTEPLQLNWNNSLSPGSYQYVSPPDTTVYLVSAGDAHNCPSDTLATTVNVLGPLTLVLPDTLIVCPDVDNQLFASLPSGGDGSYAFDWGQGPSADTLQVINLTASQNICLTLTDGCETPPLPLCTYFDVLPIPDLELTADTVLGCAPFHVTFTVKDTTGGATVDWNFGTDASVLAGPVRDYIYTLSGYYDITANVHWPNGCSDDTTITHMIRLVPIPEVDFTWDPNPTSILMPAVHFTELADNWAVSYQWNIAGDTASGPETTYTFPADVGGTYPVTLRVANYLGCADSVMRLVEVNDEFLVFTPNAFTPDGDGHNDLFLIEGNDIDTEHFRLLIYDRWGELVFSTTDRYQPWDGKLNGTRVSEGVYVWKLDARSAYTQDDHELVGHVTVLH